MAAMLSALDDSLSAVVDAFKARGMWEDTVMIFTTDNGGNLHGSGYNFPLRGGKYSEFEGGVRATGWVNGGYLDEIDYGHTNARGTYCVDDDTPLPEPWRSSVSGGKPPEGGMRAPPPSAVSDIDWPGAGGAGRQARRVLPCARQRGEPD